jgi:hypothetical protein
MRYSLFLGAAALVAASPAPQAFDVNQFNALPNNVAQGPKAGVTAESAYNQAQAQNTAAAAATGVATAQQAKRSVGAQLEARDPTFWWNWNQAQNNQPAPAPAVTPAPATTAAPAANPSSTNLAPSSCSPVDWTNTYAFTAGPTPTVHQPLPTLPMLSRRTRFTTSWLPPLRLLPVTSLLS